MTPFHCSNPLYDSVQGPTPSGQYDTIPLGNPPAHMPAGMPAISGYFSSHFEVGNIQESSSSAEKDDTL